MPQYHMYFTVCVSTEHMLYMYIDTRVNNNNNNKFLYCCQVVTSETKKSKLIKQLTKHKWH